MIGFRINALFILSIIVLYGAHAQPLDPNKELTQYNLDRITNEKIQAGILKMIQTSDGYLWMTTHDNLVCFDGVNVTLFDRFSNPEFKINGFRSVYEDLHKNLWAGSNGGGLFLKKNKYFKKFLLPFGPSSNYIESIFTDSKGNIWLGTMKGLVLFKDSTFTLVPPSFRPSNPDLGIFDISEDVKGALWIASNIGVLKYSSGILTEHEWPGISLKGEIMSIHVDSKQNIWIGSYGKGIFRATTDSITKVMELGSFGRSVSIVEDRNHNIWIGSENGVARYRNGIVSKLGAESALANVTTICEDHEGSIWLGTYYSGLARLRDGTFTNYTRSHGLPNNTVHSVFQTKDSTIWVGTETNFARFENGKFFKQPFPELAESRIRDIYTDSNDNMWIATYNGLFKLKNNTLTKFSVNEGISNERVSLVFEDMQKRLWVGTRNGLNLFDNGRWKTFSEKEGLTNSFIMSMIQLQKGTLVVGTNAGIFYFNEERFESLLTNRGKITETIFRMYEDKEGYLWVGTNIGLMSIKDAKLYSYQTDDKLLGGVIFQIIEDHLGMFWLTSNIGIVRISRKELIEKMHSSDAPLTPQLFNKTNGLPANGVTGASKGMIAFDKKIWFPTLQGAAVVDPANIVSNKIPPPIVVEKIIVDGEEFDSDETVEVKPSSRNIEIHYTALSFMVPDKVQFRYKIDGYDSYWHEVNDRRIAYYTSLPPGTYTFMLEAANNDGVWSKSHQAVRLHVQKAFWQTWGFVGFITFLIVAITYGGVNLRIKSIKEVNRKLDIKIQERTSEVLQQKEEIEAQRDYIEEKNIELEKANSIIANQYEKLREINDSLERKVEERTQELSMANNELDYFVYKSSHDIKGPLARLQGLTNLGLMESREDIAKRYFGLLQRESVLATRVIQKLTYAHQIKNMEVSFSSFNLFKMLNEIFEQLKELHSEAETIRFILDFDKDLLIKSDSRLVREILVSLIENAIVFQSTVDQFIRVTVQVVNDKVVRIRVLDNGVGIKEQSRPDIFKMFYKGSEKSVGLGLGLFIAKKATEKLDGSLILTNAKQWTEFEVAFPNQ